MEHILGMSGVGDSTCVNIATLSGTVVQRFTAGAINLFFADEQQVSYNLAEIFVTAHMAGYPVRYCRQVCAGVAGLLGVSQASVKLTSMLKKTMYRCGYSGDALLLGGEQIALAGALGHTKGAILIAGSTSTCFGQNTMGRQHCTGGLGALCDDDGSAYAIGREILRAVGRANDGRSLHTRLTVALYRRFTLGGPGDLTNLLRNGGLSDTLICELARELAPACQKKDTVALSIAEKMTAQLVGLVIPVIEKLGIQKGTLAVAGDVLLGNDFIGAAVKKQIDEKYPDLVCVPSRSDSVAGAVLLAKERLLRGA